jgi:hypothetical protein
VSRRDNARTSTARSQSTARASNIEDVDQPDGAKQNTSSVRARLRVSETIPAYRADFLAAWLIYPIVMTLQDQAGAADHARHDRAISSASLGVITDRFAPAQDGDRSIGGPASGCAVAASISASTYRLRSIIGTFSGVNGAHSK